MTHECSQKDVIHDIKKVLYGNGRPGLIQDMAELTTNMSLITQVINKMDANIEDLLAYYNQTKGRSQYKNQTKGYNRWLVGIIISLLGVIAIFAVEYIRKP
jgi:hypothetical protein